MSDRTIGENVNRAARLFRRLADQRLAPFGLSAGYLPVLTALLDGRAMSQKALTEHAGIEQPTMAATLGRMERDGLIARQPDPADKRSARFSITAPIRALAPQIAAAIRDMNAEVLTNLSAGDVEVLRLSLSIVAAAIETALEGRTG